MFENVSLFEHFHSMFKKSAIINQHFFSLTKNKYGVSKNAEFYADFKFVKMGSKKCPEKKL
jgi:hypothetical protein